MKIGLFFGSFNPIHTGHLVIAHLVKETTDIREIWFIVSPQNPLKKNKRLLHEFDRYDLVQAAIAEEYAFKVSDVEFNMPKPSYTIDTLIRLVEKHPQKKFKLIIGQDNLLSFTKWKNHQSILSDFGIIAYPRPGAENTALDTHHNVQLIEAPKMDFSASLIRKLVYQGKSIKYLVPDRVADLIKYKGFYKN